MLTKENVYGKIKKLIWKTMLCRCSSMVECQPSKLNTWVRFPSPAPFCTMEKRNRSAIWRPGGRARMCL